MLFHVNTAVSRKVVLKSAMRTRQSQKAVRVVVKNRYTCLIFIRYKKMSNDSLSVEKRKNKWR